MPSQRQRVISGQNYSLENQTPEHILQRCPLLRGVRQTMWMTAIPVQTKASHESVSRRYIQADFVLLLLSLLAHNWHRMDCLPFTMPHSPVLLTKGVQTFPLSLWPTEDVPGKSWNWLEVVWLPVTEALWKKTEYYIMYSFLFSSHVGTTSVNPTLN